MGAGFQRAGKRDVVYSNRRPPKYDSFGDLLKDAMQRRDIRNIGELADRLGLGHDMFYKRMNGSKPTHDRYLIVATCYVLGLRADETNDAMRLYSLLCAMLKSGVYSHSLMAPLDSGNPTERRLRRILDENAELMDEDGGKSWHPTIDDLNQKLGKDFEIDLQKGSRKAKAKALPKPPYPVVGKWVTRDFCGSWEESAPFYDLDWVSVRGEMRLERNKGCIVQLECRTNGPLLRCTTDLTVNEWRDGEHVAQSWRHFDSTEGTGEFQGCLEELRDDVMVEVRSLESTLDDTRNYGTRVSWRPAGDALLVFAETYGYEFPEAGEYYLMERRGSSYRMLVSRRSMFMMEYLRPKGYADHYGRTAPLVIGAYSEEPTPCAKEGVPEFLARIRASAFRKLRARVDETADSIKSGTAPMPGYFPERDDIETVIRCFGLEGEFGLHGKADDYGCDVDRWEVDHRCDDGTVVRLDPDILWTALQMRFDPVSVDPQSLDKVCHVIHDHGSLESMLE